MTVELYVLSFSLSFLFKFKNHLKCNPTRNCCLEFSLHFSALLTKALFIFLPNWTQRSRWQESMVWYCMVQTGEVIWYTFMDSCASVNHCRQWIAPFLCHSKSNLSCFSDFSNLPETKRKWKIFDLTQWTENEQDTVLFSIKVKKNTDFFLCLKSDPSWLGSSKHQFGIIYICYIYLLLSICKTAQLQLPFNVQQEQQQQQHFHEQFICRSLSSLGRAKELFIYEKSELSLLSALQLFLEDFRPDVYIHFTPHTFLLLT